MRARAANKDETRVLAHLLHLRRPVPNSRDHVIPDCFFKSPRPANLLTLPAHYSCHNRLGDNTRATYCPAWDRKVAASPRNCGIQRRSAHSSGAPRSRKSVKSSLIRKIDLISPAGLIFRPSACHPDRRDRFYPLMRKIVQGMYLYHTGEFLPPIFRSAWSLNVLLELSGDRRRLLGASRFGLVYPEVFGCRYLLVNEGPEAASVWWLCFYTDVVLRCMCPRVISGRPWLSDHRFAVATRFAARRAI